MRPADAFSRLVSSAMERRGLGLRELCRLAGLDPSLLSKILAGKRGPPSAEEPLRRLAAALELDAVAVIVAAGLIPADWEALRSDAALLRAVHDVATGRGGAPRPSPARPAAVARPPRAGRATPPPILPGRGLSEELL